MHETGWEPIEAPSYEWLRINFIPKNGLKSAHDFTVFT